MTYKKKKTHVAPAKTSRPMARLGSPDEIEAFYKALEVAQGTQPANTSRSIKTCVLAYPRYKEVLDAIEKLTVVVTELSATVNRQGSLIVTLRGSK